jgi:hypothetical protein
MYGIVAPCGLFYLRAGFCRFGRKVFSVWTAKSGATRKTGSGPIPATGCPENTLPGGRKIFRAFLDGTGAGNLPIIMNYPDSLLFFLYPSFFVLL